ncbi:cytochrome c biogenesis CcdA family protein [Methanococcoides methylutens]|uniref:Thiol:disulfide interchange protein n=1 Tax=Methanococcoides methylutens MM1 TaxID=1434104 RepID=A0A0E3SR13_METMT|nr:cytochrome c biogenesis CcdA family protein [Methanococcoides methylutens]AKB84552.1 thiol:disulfide interchange protein precursor [Methanococcoides methylutens MM1]
MDFGGVTPIAAFVAGLISIFSPCVLPLLPAIFAYSTSKGPLRPVAIVIGLTISFTIMGVVTSAFGSLFQQYLLYLSLFAGLVIILFGFTLIFDLGIFNRLAILSGKGVKEKGLLGGLLLGMSLGIIWIPCVGPILASILALVAVEGDIAYGAFLLFIYSMGLGIPMLVIAYSANISSSALGKIAKYDVYLKKGAGAVLILVGLWMLYSNVFVRF